VSVFIRTSEEHCKYKKLEIRQKLPATLISSRDKDGTIEPRLLLQRDFYHKLVAAVEAFNIDDFEDGVPSPHAHFVSDNHNSKYHDTMLIDGLKLEDRRVQESLGIAAYFRDSASSRPADSCFLQFAVNLSPDQSEEMDL
jgi:hypothetical protein